MVQIIASKASHSQNVHPANLKLHSQLALVDGLFLSPSKNTIQGSRNCHTGSAL